MEQKRILWIIAAVGVFLLVVLGGALIIYSPSSKSSRQIVRASATKTVSNDSEKWVTLSSGSDNVEKTEVASIPVQAEDKKEVQVLSFNKDMQVAKVGELTVIADNATVINKNYEGKNGFPEVQAPSEKPAPVKEESVQNIYNTTNVAITPSAVAAIDTKNVVSEIKPRNTHTVQEMERTEKQNQRRVCESRKPDVKPETKPAARIESRVANVQAPKKDSVKPAEAKKETKPASSNAKKTTQYWVQVASLSSRKNADSAREVLGENKITADVFTYKDNSDKLYYRVRVGPYTTKSEAEYWRTEIAKIDSFTKTSSFVTSTVTD